MGESTPISMRSSSLRAFGTSGINLSLLGFGAAPIGNLYRPVSDDQAQTAVLSAVRAGIRYFDTAPHYGFGLSEARLGNTLRELEEPAVISSKVGRILVPTGSNARVRHGFADAPPLEPVFDYTYDGVMRSFEASLKRLQVAHIDILLAHDLGPLTHGHDHPDRFREFMDGGYLAMNKLKADGLVSAIGLGANEWQICDAALRHGDFDGFLLAGRYTLLEQAPCEHFLPLCARRNASVILGGPFNSGILATGVKAGPGGASKQPLYYNYEPASQAIVDRVAALESVCDEFSLPLAAAALQFPAAHPQICSVLAGLANHEQVERAVKLMNSEIPAAFWDELRARHLLHPAAIVPA